MPSLRTMKRVFVVFFIANALFLLYPGVVPFSGARPFMLGVPFPLFFASAWIVGGFIVLLLLDRAYNREHGGREDA